MDQPWFARHRIVRNASNSASASPRLSPRLSPLSSSVRSILSPSLPLSFQKYDIFFLTLSSLIISIMLYRGCMGESSSISLLPFQRVSPSVCRLFENVDIFYKLFRLFSPLASVALCARFIPFVCSKIWESSIFYSLENLRIEYEYLIRDTFLFYFEELVMIIF